MMNVFSTTLNRDLDNRLFFHEWADLVAFLRAEMEKDGCTYPAQITSWRADRHRKKLTCSMQWVRMDKATNTSKIISKTVTCHEPDEVTESVESINSYERFSTYPYKARLIVRNEYHYKTMTW